LAGGSVINTASFLAAMGAASSQMACSAAKAGVLQLSRDLGVHLARRGVRVSALVLGPIETPQLRELRLRRQATKPAQAGRILPGASANPATTRADATRRYPPSSPRLSAGMMVR
jgi:NAD(P)-dependent dehydrogenase (short-subunit alcohol dehydrogenase family)